MCGLDAVVARLDYMEEECLLDALVVRTNLGGDTCFQGGTRRPEERLTAIQRGGDVVQPAPNAFPRPTTGDVAGFAGNGKRYAYLDPVVEDDALGAAQTQITLEELAAGGGIHGEAVVLIQPPTFPPRAGWALDWLRMAARRSHGTSSSLT